MTAAETELPKPWMQLPDKLLAAGLENASDAVYLAAALEGGEEQLNYPDVVVRLRTVLEEAGWCQTSPAQVVDNA